MSEQETAQETAESITFKYRGLEDLLVPDWDELVILFEALGATVSLTEIPGPITVRWFKVRLADGRKASMRDRTQIWNTYLALANASRDRRNPWQLPKTYSTHDKL